MTNQHDHRLLEMVRRVDPDIAWFQETDEWWERELAPLADSMPHGAAQAQTNYFGIHLFSKLPLKDVQIHQLTNLRNPSVFATVVLRSGQEAKVYAIRWLRQYRPPFRGRCADARAPDCSCPATASRLRWHGAPVGNDACGEDHGAGRCNAYHRCRCIAPPDWLASNLRLIAAGADAVARRAVIEPIDAALIPAALHAADARECAYAALLDEIASLLDPDPVDPWPRHDEQNGASIAVRVAAWHRAGGIPAVTLGEDRAFLAALRRNGALIRHAPEVWVMVSGRVDGRASALTHSDDSQTERPVRFSAHGTDSLGDRERVGSGAT